MTARADKNRKPITPITRQPDKHEEDDLAQHATDLVASQKLGDHAVPPLNPQNILRLQRLIGNQAVQRLLAKQGAAPVAKTPQPAQDSPALQLRRQLTYKTPIRIQRAVDTWAGKWDTDKYDSVKLKDVTGGPEYAKAAKIDPETLVGVNIELKFEPGDPVDATKIGTLQMVKSVENGKPLNLPNTAGRALPAGDADEGSQIDRYAGDGTNYGNPLYATDAPAKGDKLETTPTVPDWGKHGHRFKDKDGKVDKEDATLKDQPVLGGRGANASQIFETQALAVEGTQAGTFYGSVQWGWQSDAKGNFKQLPLSLVSSDVPTDTFGRASEQWNKSKTPTGGDTIDLPVVKGKFVNAEGVWLVTNPSHYKTTRTDKLPKDARVEVTDKGEDKKFNQVSDDIYKWWKVTVVDGTAIGKVGWVMQHFLSDAKSK